MLAWLYWQTSFQQLGLNTEPKWIYPLWVALNMYLWAVGLYTLLYILDLAHWLCNGCENSSEQRVAPTNASVLTNRKAKTKK